MTPSAGVRPTAQRVRESVFSRLGDVRDCRVLDLFAGSGAMGIEAISRGAESLVSVDRSERVIDVLRQNFERAGLAKNARWLCADARRAVQKLAAEGRLFDLVFLDPPYAASPVLHGTLVELVEQALLAPTAVVVAERAKRHSLAPVRGLRVEHERRFGETVIAWLSPAASLIQRGGE